MGRLVPEIPIDLTGLLLPQTGPIRQVWHVSCATNPTPCATSNALSPDFLRMRFAPPRHQVVTEEINRELVTRFDKGARDMSLVEDLVERQTNGDDRKRSGVGSMTWPRSRWLVSGFHMRSRSWNLQP